MIGEGKIVCVTGASGFIGSWLVKCLLSRGYTVRATVLNLKDPNQVEHLVELEGAKERLHLFEADLLIDRSFDVAINGCDGVFHVAALISYSATKEEIVDTALKGTLNVLESCARTTSIKRVVITSSAVSVICRRNQPTPNDVVDETCFSDKDYAEETKQWYILAKTVAEEEAWKFAKEKGIDLVTLHPSVVIGPLLQPTLNFSNSVIVDLIKEGKEFMSSEVVYYVDVRDVVDAHIKAFEVPSANGRYILVGERVHSCHIFKIVHQLYPSFSIPSKFQRDILTLPPAYHLSQEKVKSLGVQLTPFDVSLKDTLESLKEKKFLKF